MNNQLFSVTTADVLKALSHRTDTSTLFQFQIKDETKTARIEATKGSALIWN